MSTIDLIIKTSTLTVLVLEAASVLYRLRAYNDKREPLLFFLIIAILCFKLIFPDLLFIGEISTLLVIFIVRKYLSLIIPHKREKIYNFSFFAVMLMTLSLIPTAVYGSIPFKFFHTFTSIVLAVPVGLLIYRLFIKMGKRYFLVILATAVLFCGASGFERWLPVLSHPAFSLSGLLFLTLALSLGYLIFEEGYFTRGSLKGMAARMTEAEERSREISQRLLSTEQSLIAQDKLISLGVLAGGLTHEFKNILSLISGCAQFGLLTPLVEKKDQSLSLIQEHVTHSLTSVISVLERIKTRKKIEPEETDLGEFLNRLAKIVRANYRAYDITVALDIQSPFRAAVKQDDLEQILLNLIRNAAAALQKKTAGKTRRICLVARREGAGGIIEVRDNAGGIGENDAWRLFEAHEGDSSSSTGLGLYLTRLLAEQNGLLLNYASQDGESRFSLIFSPPQLANAPKASNFTGNT